MIMMFLLQAAVDVSITARGLCGDLQDGNILNHFDCMFQTSFLNDNMIFIFFFLLAMAYMGMKMNMPFAVMYMGAFAIMWGLWDVYNIPYIETLLQIMVIGAALYAVVTLYTGAKRATQ